MAAVPYAHIVAKLLNSKHPKGTDIELAPNPKDIVSHVSVSPTKTPKHVIDLGEHEQI